MAANHVHMHPPPQQNDGYVKIASLQPQMNCINTYGIVLENRKFAYPSYELRLLE